MLRNRWPETGKWATPGQRGTRQTARFLAGSERRHRESDLTSDSATRQRKAWRAQEEAGRRGRN